MKSLTKAQRNVLAEVQAILDDESLETVNAIGYEIKELVNQKMNEWIRSEQYRKHLEEDEARRQKEQKLREKRDAKAAKWVAANIVAGDIIKVSGARDGHGIRRVENMSSHRIVCRAYEKTWSRESNGDIPALAVTSPRGNTIVFTERNQLTEHMLEKVVSVLRDGEMKRIDDLAGIK